MTRILIVECMQEISSFNPLPSGYENFHIQRGDEIYAQRGRNPAIGGALSVFDARPRCRSRARDLGARAGSAGLLSAAGWQKLSTEILDAVRAKHRRGRRRSISRCTAPWGPTASSIRKAICWSETRKLAGNKPIVISLDLHGILTDRMLRQVDGLAIYHTYPHVDFADTGGRAARAAAAADRQSRAKPDHRARRHPGAGARRRADHQDRLLRRPDPRVPAPRARRHRARRRAS